MIKYWYFTYNRYSVNGNSIGYGVCFSEDGMFDLAEVLECLRNRLNTQDVVIESWQEISSIQYEKMQKFFDKKNK